MAKKESGILTTAEDAVVGTGAVVADTAKAGFEGAKGLAVSRERRRWSGDGGCKEGSESCHQEETYQEEKSRQPQTKAKCDRSKTDCCA